MAVSRETLAPRLSALGARFGLPAAAVDQLTRLIELLNDDPLAPTTVTSPAQALDVHLADSLVALELDVVRRARTVADIGSGAGFPGLPLAAALPKAQVSLVESSSRKCAFLERARTHTQIGNAQVACARAEQWQEGHESCDLVTARAVGSLTVVAEYAAPLLRVGGHLIAWKGQRQPDEEADAAAAAAILSLAPADPLPVAPYVASRDRWLHCFRKTGPTPSRFPRRPGMASKRPLRASSGDSSPSARTVRASRR